MIDFSSKHIAVIGDVMLDRYIYGNCSRISPEAPVPVVEVTDEVDQLGGAGNVAANLASLGCKTILVGSVGSGPEAEANHLAFLCGGHKIVPYLYSCAYQTTVKTRIIANKQQIVRYDYDGMTETFPPKWCDWPVHGIRNCDAIILSDYGKGVVSKQMAQEVIKTKIIVFVDPKDGNWNKYSGAFCVKPNIYELRRHVGYDIEIDNLVSGSATPVLEQVCANNSFQCILVTLGEDGMVLYRRSWSSSVHIEAEKKEVIDLSGAGDTAIAVFVASQSLGLLHAAKLANHAASVVVSRRGTSVIKKEDLK